MKLETSTLAQLSATAEVKPGNIYPAKGGRKPGTEYWLVIATSDSGAHLIGFNKDGEVQEGEVVLIDIDSSPVVS